MHADVQSCSTHQVLRHWTAHFPANQSWRSIPACSLTASIAFAHVGESTSRRQDTQPSIAITIFQHPSQHSGRSAVTKDRQYNALAPASCQWYVANDPMRSWQQRVCTICHVRDIEPPMPIPTQRPPVSTRPQRRRHKLAAVSIPIKTPFLLPNAGVRQMTQSCRRRSRYSAMRGELQCWHGVSSCNANGTSQRSAHQPCNVPQRLESRRPRDGLQPAPPPQSMHSKTSLQAALADSKDVS